MSEFRRNVAIAFVSVFVFGVPIWMLLDRDPPYTFERVTIEPTKVRPGDTIEVAFEVKPRRYSACNPGVAYRELKEESGKLHVFDPIVRQSFPAIVDNKFYRMIKLPDNITPGKIVYRGGVCYTCNPLQALWRWPVCVKTPDVEFTVVR